MTGAPPIASTLTSAQAAERTWHVVVLGAGPAGASQAALLARRGLDVLLVDRASFPRGKACGGCLNVAAVDLLAELDLAANARRSAAATERLCVAAGGRRATIPLHGGVAISRRTLDAELVRDAIAAGAHLVDGTTVQPGPAGALALVTTGASDRHELRTDLVILACGLGSTPLGRARLGPPRVARRSRVGLHAMVPAERGTPAPGTIAMGVGRGGYAGAVRVETGDIDLAMAVDPGAVREAGGPGPLAARLLHPLLGDVALAGARWTGTPPLTSRPARVASERTFVVGDAAGYVEPFTGEGIAWALASSRSLAPIAARAAVGWDDALADQWSLSHRRLLAARQRRCRVIALALRSPRLVGAALGVRSIGARVAASVAHAYPPVAEVTP